MMYHYEDYKKSADYIRDQIGTPPEVAVVLGTCLGEIAQEIQDKVEIPYGEIPNFLMSTAPGHAGKLIVGTLGGKKVLCMAGRFHHYEGYSYQELRIPVYVMKLLGIKVLVLTNAAGAINLNYDVGDICVIKDHINLCGASPQTGPNVEEMGPRFFSMNDVYTEELRKLAKECAGKLGFALQEGNYYFAPGPQFETPAEIHAMRLLGGDMVGMSTVPEAITAAQCGVKVLCLSLATNLSADQVSDHDVTEDVDNVTDVVSGRFRSLLKEIIHCL